MLKQKAYRIKRFLTHDIWNTTNEDVRGVYRWLINVFKAVYLSIRFFLAHHAMDRASALTYYTLLAIVPMFALLLAVFRGFEMQELLWESLRQNLPTQGEAIDYISAFAETYLDQAKSSVVMGVGVIMLLYIIYSLINKVENVFNEIWQQKHGRSTIRQITDYLSIMIIVPLFLTISVGVQIFLQTYIKTDLITTYYELSQTLLEVLQWLPMLLTVGTMTFIYMAIPNCKVKFVNAFAAALIAGSAFMAFQWLYISGQIWVSKYNAIYGSFAALPLLLLWIQMAWIICLYGAELSYASQNIQNYDFENLEQVISRRDHDFLMAIVSAHIYNRFSRQLPPPTTEEIGQALHLPARLTGYLVRQLSDLDIIHEGVSAHDDQPNYWVPGREPDKFSLASLMEVLNTSGKVYAEDNYSKQFATTWAVCQRMNEAASAEGSKLLLRDVCTDEFKPSGQHKVKKDDKKTTN